MEKNLNQMGSMIPDWFKKMKFLQVFLISALLLITLNGFSQQANIASVSGRITDADGNPVTGATIQIQGTTRGTLSDVDGRYLLNDVPARGTLLFSFVGYVSQQISVASQTTINVTLQIDAVGLEEIVVVGYGTQKKVTLTGSTTVIKNEDLIISPAPTATQALAGKAPGIMTRMPDGRPGNASALQIRNMGTPLYVIDGNQSSEDAFNNIDMNDIESISILKDASAAIYGMQAANGVVLVSTKKGKTGEKTKINVNTYTGWQNWTRFAKAAKASTFVFAKASAEVNNKMAADGTGIMTTWTQAEVEKWQAGTEKDIPGTDWYDFAVKENAPQSYINVSATGGSENTSYYLSLSRLNQDGSFAEYNFNRTNIQSNIESKINKRITIGARISGQVNNTNSPAAPGDVMWNPLYGLYRNYPTWYPYANDNPNYVNHTGWDESQHALFFKDIIGYYEQINRSLSPTIYAEYQTPLKGLSARVQYQLSLNQGSYDRFQYIYNTYTYNEATDIYEVKGGLTAGSHARNSTLSLTNSYQAQVNYAASFGSHNLKATYVFEARDSETPSNMSVSSKPSSNYLELIQYAEVTGFTNTWSASSSVGHVGRINYDYKSKYLLELSGRYDGTYKFPPDHRYGFFPSAAIGWRISEEDFYKATALAGILDNFKLRASYGMLGNDSPGNYSAWGYLAGYTFNSGSQVFDGAIKVGTDVRDPGTTTLSWAKAYIFDAGFDFSIKKGVISGEFDFFRRDMKGLSSQRYDILIPEEINITLPYENLNAQMQQGVDALVRHNGKFGHGINYGVSVNVGFSRAKVTEVYKPRFGNSWDYYRNATVDRYTGETWLYECIGQFQSMEEINNYPVNIDGQGNRTLLPGDLIYKDVNNDGIISNLDMRPLGYGQATSSPWGWGTSRTGLPNLSYGLTANISWKGFDISISGQGASMATFIREWELRNPLQGDANSSDRVLSNSWHQADIYNPSDNGWIASTYPAIRTNQQSHSNGSRASTFWATNVTYLRLRNLDFGYNVPKKWLTKIGIQSLRLYGNGYNLLSIDNLRKYSVDPEVSTTSGLQYPQSKIINVGANVTF